MSASDDTTDAVDEAKRFLGNGPICNMTVTNQSFRLVGSLVTRIDDLEAKLTAGRGARDVLLKEIDDLEAKLAFAQAAVQDAEEAEKAAWDKLAAANAIIDDLAGDSNDADDLRDKLAAVTSERDEALSLLRDMLTGPARG